MVRPRKQGLGRRRNPTEKLLPNDLEMIARLAMEGLSGPKIRAAVNAARADPIALSTIQHRIAAMDREYLARMTDHVAARKARLHARVEHMVAVAMDGYRKSQRAEPMQLIVDGKMTTEDGPGDPRFLAIVINLMDREARLLGADKLPDAPPVFIGNPLRLGDGMTLEQAAEVNAMTGQQLIDLAAECQRELAAAKAQVQRAAKGEDEEDRPN